MHKSPLSTIVLLFCLFPFFVLAEDQNDPSSWSQSNWATADYSSLTGQQLDYYLNRGDVPISRYVDVSWSKVTDFSKLSLAQIPDQKWSQIDQSKIMGGKVAEIPSQHFNPQKVTKENLKFSNEAQITAHIERFNNLRDANPDTVRTVFLTKYSADLDVNKATTIRMRNGLLEGEFPTYNPSQLPKTHFKQFIVGDTVKIVPLSKTGESFPSVKGDTEIKGAKTFSLDEKGNIAIIPAEGKKTSLTGASAGSIRIGTSTYSFENKGTLTIDSKGDIDATNARVTIGSSNGNSQILDGKFSTRGSIIKLESFGGKQSSYHYPSKNLQVTSVGHPLLVLPENGRVSTELSSIQNKVTYGQDSLTLNGAAVVKRGDFFVQSKDSAGFFHTKTDYILTRGVVEIDHPDFRYIPHSPTLVFERKIENNVEKVLFSGGDFRSNAGLYIKKVNFGFLQTVATPTIDAKMPLYFQLKRDSQGTLRIDSDMYESTLKTLAGIGKGVVNPGVWIANEKQDLEISLESTSRLTYRLDLSSEYDTPKGKLNYANPSSVIGVFGEKPDNKNNLLAQVISQKLLGQVPDTYEENDAIMLHSTDKDGKSQLAVAKVLAKDSSGNLIVDVNGQRQTIYKDNSEPPSTTQTVLKSIASVTRLSLPSLGLNINTEANMPGIDKSIHITVIPVDNTGTAKTILDSPAAEVTYSILSPNKLPGSLEKDIFNIVIPTGHHSTGNPYLYGERGGLEFSRLYIEDIPQGTDMLLPSACATSPKFENPQDVDSYTHFLDSKGIKIAFGYEGTTAPLNDRTIPEAVSAKNLALLKSDPSKYVETMVDIGGKNAIEQTRGLIANLHQAMQPVVGYAAKPPYYFVGYIKTDDRGWVYFSPNYPRGTPVRN